MTAGGAAVDRALDHWAAPVPGVVVTCGGEGAVAALDGSRHRVPALAVPVVDATGAGGAEALPSAGEISDWAERLRAAWVRALSPPSPHPAVAGTGSMGAIGP